MSEKKIVVPEGMLKAADDAQWNGVPTDVTQDILQAALGWLSENPIVPTEEQVLASYCGCNHGFGVQSDDPESLYSTGFQHGADWVQRRMFCAPEPEVPEAVKDLLADAMSPSSRWNACSINASILEAYRRGQQAEKPRVATYRKCARPDCTNPPFKVGKREKLYCSHSCAHLMAVRASRKRHPKGKA